MVRPELCGELGYAFGREVNQERRASAVRSTAGQPAVA
jgi:hypothetical protein